MENMAKRKSTSQVTLVETDTMHIIEKPVTPQRAQYLSQNLRQIKKRLRQNVKQTERSLTQEVVKTKKNQTPRRSARLERLVIARSTQSGPSRDQSDDYCGVCGDGGDLLCCDSCPSTYHAECMGMEAIPAGEWYCTSCRCPICGGPNCIDDKSCLSDNTILFCDQCELKYHVKCLRSRGSKLESYSLKDSFCGESCERIFRGLQELVGVPQPLEAGLSWTLLRSSDREDGCESTKLKAETDKKLLGALSVMLECFKPIIDPRTNIEILSQIIYNRRSEVTRLNCGRFYTMVLEKGDAVISAATIRVHGATLAEIAFVGTSFTYRKQGMCRKLMSMVDEVLRSLKVERLVLHAVHGTLETWIDRFGFQKVGGEKLDINSIGLFTHLETTLVHRRLV